MPIDRSVQGQRRDCRRHRPTDRRSPSPSRETSTQPTSSATDLVLSGSALNPSAPAHATSLTWIDAHTVEFNLTGQFNTTRHAQRLDGGRLDPRASRGPPIVGYSDNVVLKLVHDRAAGVRRRRRHRRRRRLGTGTGTAPAHRARTRAGTAWSAPSQEEATSSCTTRRSRSSTWSPRPSTRPSTSPKHKAAAPKHKVVAPRSKHKVVTSQEESEVRPERRSLGLTRGASDGGLSDQPTGSSSTNKKPRTSMVRGSFVSKRFASIANHSRRRECSPSSEERTRHQTAFGCDAHFFFRL